MNLRNNEMLENLEAEIVVIGGGGAGLAAAVAAAEKGASVIVLEKRGVLGGNSALARGIFAAESTAQKRDAIDASRDHLFKIAMSYAHYRIDPDIIRAFIHKSGDTIRWLEEKGLDFELVPFYLGQVPITWHCPKGWGAHLIKVLVKNCQDLGVKLLRNTQAKKLLIGKDGKVGGVLAINQDGEGVIPARSIIIATGGYGGNKELLKKYCPTYQDNFICDGLPHTGDGLLMALEIGAAAENAGTLIAAGPFVPGKVLLKSNTKTGETVYVPLMAITLEPNTLWVNHKGERFVDEAVGGNHYESTNALLRQPGNVCYTIIDTKIKQQMEEEGLIVGLGLSRKPQRTEIPGLEKGLRLLEKKGWVKISGSWDEIADWMVVDRTILKATIDEYNSACDHNHDPIFCKDRRFLEPLHSAPYYAIRASVGYLDTIGGIKIDEHMEVLDKQDHPIPGLYAAGITTGGWESETYCAMLSGSAFGFAVNSGRIAAENAVKFIASKLE